MAKRIIKCISCGKPARLYGGYSYSVTMKELRTNPLTGEKNFEEVKGRICTSCYLEAGYSVSTTWKLDADQEEKEGGEG